MTPRLHVERRGSRGPRLALVHGFTQTGASWAPVAAALGPGYRLLLPDCPGHGRSASVDARSPAEAADLLATSCGRAAYAGYSMGGRLCLQAALDRPDLVQALVLVSASAGIEEAAARAERRRSDEALADRLDPPPGSHAGAQPLAEFLAGWLAGPLFAHLDEEAADLGARLANTSAGLAASLRGVGTGTMAPLWGRLGELRMPLLVVAGADDARFTAHARRLAAAVPGATLEIVPGAGHAVPFEAPAHFAALLAAWLDAVTGRSRPPGGSRAPSA